MRKTHTGHALRRLVQGLCCGCTMRRVSMAMTAVAQERWYYRPAVIIVAGCIVAVISFGVRSSMGLFTHPISEFHMWDREIYGLAMAIQNLMWGVVQPIA